MTDNEKVLDCLVDMENYLAKLAKSRAIQINLDRALREKIRNVRDTLKGKTEKMA